MTNGTPVYIYIHIYLKYIIALNSVLFSCLRDLELFLCCFPGCYYANERSWASMCGEIKGS